jgi:hypothetical protein
MSIAQNIFSRDIEKSRLFFNSGKIGTHGRQAKWGGRVTTGISKAWCKDKQQEVASEAVTRCIRLLSDLGTRSSQRLLLKKGPHARGVQIHSTAGHKSQDSKRADRKNLILTLIYLQIRTLLQGDQKVSVHLMITVQKTRKDNLNSFSHLPW